MSFSDQAKTDTAAFLEQFGDAAVFDGTKQITVIFDNASIPVLDADTGGIMIAGPQATCKTADVPDAKGKTLKIDSVTYYIKEAQDDGTGVTILRLSKD